MLIIYYLLAFIFDDIIFLWRTYLYLLSSLWYYYLILILSNLFGIMSAEDSQLQILTSQYQESFLLDRN